MYNQTDKSYFQVDKDIYFGLERLPYKVMALSDRYAICVRRFNRKDDAHLLHQCVSLGAYMSFTEAYNDNKNSPVYTIVDFEDGVRAPDDLIFPAIDYFDKKACEEAIQMLHSKKLSLSKRNKTVLIIDKDRTLNGK